MARLGPTPRRLSADLMWTLARPISLIVLAAAWELAARSGSVTPFVLPSLSSVVERIWHDATTGDLAINAGLSLYRAFLGFLIAGSGGVLLGLLMTRVAPVRWFFDPLVSIGFPMPKIAFLPVVVLWLGLLSLIVAIVTEMLMGGYGLGGAMMTASRFADSRGVFAGIVEIAIVGYVLVKAMAVIRRRLLIWHPEALDPSTA